MTETDIESYAGRFRTMIDRSFRGFGLKDGMPDRLREAVRAIPRHRFVHRFRLKDDSALHDLDAAPEATLPLVYTDAAMFHVDVEGRPLPSSNSQPSYVLWLLTLLDLQPGHRVLEIGSGSGWLAAVMGRLVGEAGHVTGVEILASLAEQSRADLAANGPTNVTIRTGDGTRQIEGSPFDRVMVTAATWDITPGLFDSVVEGGRLLAPIRLRGGGGCRVVLLRREGDAFVAERGTPGFFVPLFGPEQPAEHRPERLAETLAARALGPEPTATFPFPLGQNAPEQHGPAAWSFGAYLRIVEDGFVALVAGATEESPFIGLLDEASGSLAICRHGAMEVYGAPRAAERLALAYRRWADLGMPGMEAFNLSVLRASAAPAPDGDTHVEHRGTSVLVWRLRPAVGAWRELLRAGR